MKSLELKLPPVALLALLALAMWATARWAPPLGRTTGAQTALALGIAALGGAICLAGVGSFHRAKTTVDPTRPGAATSLVQGGIYRLTRNPMYLGFLLMLGAWALYLRGLLPWAFLPLFVGYLNRFQIRPEERFLTARFGASFIAYCQRVRRWI